MKAHVTKKFLLIGSPKHPWRRTLQAAIKPLGELDASDEAQSYLQKYEKNYDLVLVDASEVEHAEELVARLRSQLPSSRVVVVDAAPTWQQAREAFLAGAMDYFSKTGDEDKLSKLLSDLVKKPVA
jgi:DNA-binding NtrC family response regulator